MFSLTCFKWRFTPRWIMFIITILTMAFLMRLGFWQINRAEEKELLLNRAHSQSLLAPTAWQSTSPNPLPYQSVQIEGRYLSELFLLDNQSHQHQFGYHVYSPLLMSDQKVVLVDRGWVPGELTRQKMPDVSTPSTPQSLIGIAYYPSEKVWILGQAVEKKDNNVWVIEQVDVKWASQLLHKSVYPFIMRLDAKAEFGFTREWPIVAMSPARHYAYALQWFVMAFVVFILFIILNTKRLP